jgi:formamidopyrimidine-DNA glycosylase
MPELAEVDAYRRLATRALERRVAEVVAPDSWYLRGGLEAGALADALVGRRFVDARRIGKLLLLDTDGDGPVLGLRFGMSGRLLVDGTAGVDGLLYSSTQDLERWDRFGLRFADGGDLRIRDPRRLGGVELCPPEDRLGPDALTVTAEDLAAALGRSQAPLKARLLDQARLAGVGNLAADEILWRAGLDPGRPAGTLSPKEVARLHEHLVGTLADLIAKGGSHAGDLQPERRPGGACPTDGTPLIRRTVGGRTTWSCPKHQR